MYILFWLFSRNQAAAEVRRNVSSVVIQSNKRASTGSSFIHLASGTVSSWILPLFSFTISVLNAVLYFLTVCPKSKQTRLAVRHERSLKRGFKVTRFLKKYFLTLTKGIWTRYYSRRTYFLWCLTLDNLEAVCVDYGFLLGCCYRMIRIYCSYSTFGRGVAFSKCTGLAKSHTLLK